MRGSAASLPFPRNRRQRVSAEGIEEHLEAAEPLPLVIDDALIKFDDGRAQATLRILHELSGKTQVLFFTHHHRLVELALEAIPAGHFKVHELDGAMPR